MQEPSEKPVRELFDVRESSGGAPTLLRFSWLLFVDARLA